MSTRSADFCSTTSSEDVREAESGESEVKDTAEELIGGSTTLGEVRGNGPSEDEEELELIIGGAMLPAGGFGR